TIVRALAAEAISTAPTALAQHDRIRNSTFFMGNSLFSKAQGEYERGRPASPRRLGSPFATHRECGPCTSVRGDNACRPHLHVLHAICKFSAVRAGMLRLSGRGAMVHARAQRRRGAKLALVLRPALQRTPSWMFIARL